MPFNSSTKVMISVHRIPGSTPPTAPAPPSAKPVGSEQQIWLAPELKLPTISIATAPTGVVSPPPLQPLPAATTTGGATATGGVKSGHFVCVVKGAPEYILDRCKTRYVESVDHAISEVELTRSQADDVLRQAETFAGNGERLIAVAEIVLPIDQFPVDYQFRTNPMNFPAADLCLVGLISVMDPPRADVPQAVADCQTASIQVCMVTGDHPSTAVAIARQVGIIRSPLEKVLTWSEAKRVPMVFGVDANGEPIVPDCACCGATCPWYV